MTNVAISSAGPNASSVDVAHNLRTVRTYIRERGLIQALKALEQPPPLLFFCLIIVDWAVIFAAMALALCVSAWLLPLSMIVIASRQRALGIFIHDATHKHLCRNTRLNDLVARYLLALPLFEDFTSYRKNHTNHHRNLGHDRTDPDYVDPRWFAHISPTDTFAAAKIYLILLKVKLMAGVQLRFDALCWWSALTLMLSLCVGLHTALAMVCVWVISYLTAYKAITTFTELSDHTYGVDHDLTYTRTIPWSVLVPVCYPHNDCFHLAHHLLPGIPTPRLKQAHKMLLGMTEYANSHSCDSLAALFREWTQLLPNKSPQPRPSMASRLAGSLQRPPGMTLNPSGTA
jgi:fatty acid desaturase